MSGLTGNNILAGSSGQSTGYNIDQSLRFEDGDSPYLSRTPSSAGNRKTWTWSGWVKKGAPASRGFLFWAGNDFLLNNDGIEFYPGLLLRAFSYDSGGSYVFNIASSAYYRDTSAWYHIVVCFDSTEFLIADRAKLYVNGERLTVGISNIISNSECGFINTTTEHRIGNAQGYYQWDGYLAEVHFIDGTALTPASFGETNADTNQWQAIEYDGSYGTNGFYLKFQDSSALGDDSSGNTNDFTVTNLAATDQVIDSPTNNFATLNPLALGNSFLEGNLKTTTGTSSNRRSVSGFGMASGKWYWETIFTDLSNGAAIGIHSLSTPITTNNFVLNDGSDSSGIYYFSTNSTRYINGSSTAVGTSASALDIIGIAFDADTNTMDVYKNNVLQSSFSVVTDYTAYPIVGDGSGAAGTTFVMNFGQDSSFAGNKTAQGNGGTGEDFYYTPPTGYKALNTNNLPDPSIALPTDYFNTVLYTGNGSTQSITGVGFLPDTSWIKGRTNTYQHQIYDVVRGATEKLLPSTTDAEATDANALASFDSDGFSLGSNVGVNQNAINYVAWNWKTGGTAVSNSDGTITSSVSANTTAGFSIQTWTGDASGNATVGHGLSQAPEFIIIKPRTESRHWLIWHKDFNDYDKAMLFDTGVPSDNRFGPNAPTSSVYGLYSGQGNRNGTDFVGYAFHSVEGYSKIGSYTGNGSTDGPFIYTGFRPAFVLIKRIDSAGVWPMFDNKRIGYNRDNRQLRANETTADETYDSFIDILSNGFKCKNTAADKNASGGTYTYLAFAESPFKYSNAR